MLWLESVTFPDADEEFDFRLAEKRTCYNSMYPFFVLSQRSFSRIDFAPLTLLAGGNGCGKTTALNVIAEKLALRRSAPFNRSPFFGEYVKLCGCACRPLPEHAAVITSDDVFDFMLDARALNEGVEKRREALMREYLKLQDTPMRFRSLDDYEALKDSTDAYCKGKIRTTPLAASFRHLFAHLPCNTRVLLRHLHKNLARKSSRQRCKAIKSGRCASQTRRSPRRVLGGTGKGFNKV